MNRRGAGVLLHVTSLPSPYGIGDLGPWAYRFADFLADTRQSYWQVLPLCPTAPISGNSPYSSVSAFAGNTLLVSPDVLLRRSFISQREIDSRPTFPEKRCNYDSVIPYKESLLNLAYERFIESGEDRAGFINFCDDQESWLDTYSLFGTIKSRMGGKPWNEWPTELRDRVPESIQKIRSEAAEEVERVKFGQYLFFSQWRALKDYCNGRGILIVGDLPIYVSHDSADAWANPGIFKLDEEKRPITVAGVPPDYFSATGQLWGSPVYDWDALRQTGYAWWIDRLRHTLALYDVIRIDHFRGLVNYWEVPIRETTAINGRWSPVPTDDFFKCLFQALPVLPVIAEDLGIITPDVREAMGRFGFPGMKVLLFAFGEDNPMHVYLPHSYERDCVVYTGTHDNNTVRGWFENEIRPEEKERLFRYIGRQSEADQVSWELIRLAMMSVANLAIVPMQDILGLGQDAQMNRPSVALGNWEWRLSPAQLTDTITQLFRSLTETYGRA